MSTIVAIAVVVVVVDCPSIKTMSTARRRRRTAQIEWHVKCQHWPNFLSFFLCLFSTVSTVTGSSPRRRRDGQDFFDSYSQRFSLVFPIIFAFVFFLVAMSVTCTTHTLDCHCFLHASTFFHHPGISCWLIDLEERAYSLIWAANLWPIFYIFYLLY